MSADAPAPLYLSNSDLDAVLMAALFTGSKHEDELAKIASAVNAHLAIGEALKSVCQDERTIGLHWVNDQLGLSLLDKKELAAVPATPSPERNAIFAALTSERDRYMRAQALEDAAMLCENMSLTDDPRDRDLAQKCAAAIRRLVNPETKP